MRSTTVEHKVGSINELALLRIDRGKHNTILISSKLFAPVTEHWTPDPLVFKGYGTTGL